MVSFPPMRSHLVNLAPADHGTAERASELLSELDEWFAVSASTQGSPSDGFAAVEVALGSLSTTAQSNSSLKSAASQTHSSPAYTRRGRGQRPQMG